MCIHINADKKVWKNQSIATIISRERTGLNGERNWKEITSSLFIFLHLRFLINIDFYFTYILLKIRLTPEQRRFELHRSTYMTFSINILDNFFEICDNLKQLADEPCTPEILKIYKKSYACNEYINYM